MSGRLIRHRDFVRFWVGESVSDLGSAVTLVVFPLIAVVYLHATAFEVGALGATEWVPWLLIGLPAGVWIDRSRCRPVLIACDVARALLIASVPMAAALGELHLAQLFAVAFLTGVATVLFQVAYQSYLPKLVERTDLAEGNAKLQGTQAAAQVAGPGIGGLLVQALRAPYALVADAVSYVVSAAALLTIRHREPSVAPAPRNLRREIVEGVRYVARDPLLRPLTISPAVANFFITGATSIIVLFLVRSVHLAPASVGLLVGVVSIGSVLGAAVARPIGRRIGTSRAVWLVSLATEPVGLLVPLTHRGAGLGFFVVGNVVLLAGILVYNVTIGPFRQAYVPPDILGRVVASMRFVLYGTIPLGALTGGALAGVWGPRTAITILLAGNVLAGVVLVLSPLPGMRDLPVGPPGARLPETAASVSHT